MKRAEKEIMDAFFIEWQALKHTSDEIGEMLIKECEKVTGTKWCSVRGAYEDLMEEGHNKTGFYQRYVEANAKMDLIVELGQKFANLGYDVYIGM